LKHLKDETGIAMIAELALVAIVLVVVGVAVYAAVNHKANPVVSAKSSPSPSKSAPPPSASPTPSATPAADVLQIPALGIQMTLPSGLSKSDVYFITNVADTTAHDINGKVYHYLGNVILSTHSLTAQEPHCAPPVGSASSNEGLIAFDKTQEDVGIGYDVASNSTNYEPVGSFWMSIQDHQSLCSSSGNGALENTQYQLFVQAFKTITPIQ
jgi:hypothetical protein